MMSIAYDVGIFISPLLSMRKAREAAFGGTLRGREAAAFKAKRDDTSKGSKTP
jgi:hypothetical protein